MLLWTKGTNLGTVLQWELKSLYVCLDIAYPWALSKDMIWAIDLNKNIILMQSLCTIMCRRKELYAQKSRDFRWGEWNLSMQLSREKGHLDTYCSSLWTCPRLHTQQIEALRLSSAQQWPWGAEKGPFLFLAALPLILGLLSCTEVQNLTQL